MNYHFFDGELVHITIKNYFPYCSTLLLGSSRKLKEGEKKHTQKSLDLNSSAIGQEEYPSYLHHNLWKFLFGVCRLCYVFHFCFYAEFLQHFLRF